MNLIINEDFSHRGMIDLKHLTLDVGFDGRVTYGSMDFGMTEEPAGNYRIKTAVPALCSGGTAVEAERLPSDIDKWDRYFLRLARESAMLSQDPSSQIGAVLVQPEGTQLVTKGRIVSTGFNGFPPGIADDSRWDSREDKYRLVVHAEMNALLQAGRNRAKGSTLYMYGYVGAPCENCTKHIIASGVKRVVAGGTPVPDRWLDSLVDAAATLDEANVVLDCYDLWEFTEPNEWGATKQEARLLAGEEL